MSRSQGHHVLKWVQKEEPRLVLGGTPGGTWLWKTGESIHGKESQPEWHFPLMLGDGFYCTKMSPGLNNWREGNNNRPSKNDCGRSYRTPYAPGRLSGSNAQNQPLLENDLLEKMNREGKAGEARTEKSEGTRLFKFALVDFIKDVLKPKWKGGHINRMSHKIIVKKVADKVIYSIRANDIPQSHEQIGIYLSYSKPKIVKLVEAYVKKYCKLATIRWPCLMGPGPATFAIDGLLSWCSLSHCFIDNWRDGFQAVRL